MNNNDKAFLWSCYDCSEEEPGLEKLALRLKDEELAGKFKTAFAAAQLYNKLRAEGNTEDLVEAPVVEDAPEEVVDSLENVNAGEEAKEEEAKQE